MNEKLLDNLIFSFDGIGNIMRGLDQIKAYA